MINIDEKIENADWPKRTPDFDAFGRIVEPAVKPKAAALPWWERELAYNPYHVQSGEHGGEFTSGEGIGQLGEYVPSGALDKIESAAAHAEMMEGRSFAERLKMESQQAVEGITEIGKEMWEKSGLLGDTQMRYALSAYKDSPVITPEQTYQIMHGLELDAFATPMPMALYRGSQVIGKLGSGEFAGKLKLALDALGPRSSEDKPAPLPSLVGMEIRAPDQAESWTHNAHVGQTFAGHDGGAVLIWDAPKGIHAVNLDHENIDRYQYTEREWIPRVNRWRIIKAATVPKQGIVELHVEPVEGAHP